MSNPKILVPIVAGIVIAGGVFAYTQMRNDEKSAETGPKVDLPERVSLKTNEKQTVEDDAGLFRLEVPKNWTVTREGAKGVRLAGVSAESENYLLVEDTEVSGPHNLIYNKDGAAFMLLVIKGTESSTQEPAGKILERKKLVLGNSDANYYRFVEPSLAEGEILGVRTSHNDNSYLFRFEYNPARNPEGQEVFDEILRSFRFK